MRGWARTIKRQTLVVYYAARDPDTPWAVRLLALAVAAYALSPIDLIPDFIPVLGHLDDVLILPLGIAFVLRLLPRQVAERARLQADAAASRPTRRAMAVAIVGVWLIALGSAASWAWRYWTARSG
ncbi:DUF1232 domain-containing protein [Lysobacter humi (ex Lee et al. 2017)]